jgi:FKBP-type peptidyl-prolyl cis-trans isomerase
MHSKLSAFILAALTVGAVAFATCGDDDKPAATTAPVSTRAASSAASGSAQNGAIKLENPTVTASGLQYTDQVVGTGASPTMGQQVTVNYTGKLASNGKVFDSTAGKSPISFPMVGVIKGFSEGLLTMKVGGKRTVYIPTALGYGATGAGSAVPPNADLIFEIELISIK